MSRLSRPVLALILPAALVAVLLAGPPQPEKQPGETFAAATKKVGPAVFMTSWHWWPLCLRWLDSMMIADREARSIWRMQSMHSQTACA